MFAQLRRGFKSENQTKADCLAASCLARARAHTHQFQFYFSLHSMSNIITTSKRTSVFCFTYSSVDDQEYGGINADSDIKLGHTNKLPMVGKENEHQKKKKKKKSICLIASTENKRPTSHTQHQKLAKLKLFSNNIKSSFDRAPKGDLGCPVFPRVQNLGAVD